MYPDSYRQKMCYPLNLIFLFHEKWSDFQSTLQPVKYSFNSVLIPVRFNHVNKIKSSRFFDTSVTNAFHPYFFFSASIAHRPISYVFSNALILKGKWQRDALLERCSSQRDCKRKPHRSISYGFLFSCDFNII